jgi:hypothetical protein
LTVIKQGDSEEEEEEGEEEGEDVTEMETEPGSQNFIFIIHICFLFISEYI